MLPRLVLLSQGEDVPDILTELRRILSHFVLRMLNELAIYDAAWVPCRMDDLMLIS